jgi:hypothetical protein
VVDLGLAVEKITVSPIFYHTPMRADDYGPNATPDVLMHLAACRVRMTLIHYDDAVLDVCIGEALGGAETPGTFGAGTMPPAGTPLGKGLPLFCSGNNFISLNIIPAQNRFVPWVFPASYLTGPPLEIPFSTEKSLVVCEWMAIPYCPLVMSGFSYTLDNITNTYSSGLGEVISSGIPLWTHAADN